MGGFMRRKMINLTFSVDTNMNFPNPVFEGEIAFINYVEADDNPYNLQTQEQAYLEWHSGWLKARNTMKSDLFEEGYDAGHDGLRETHCPYCEASDERTWWMDGFHASFE